MGLFKKQNELMYFRAFSQNYESFQEQGLSPQEIILKFITDSPQSDKKPLRGFTDETANKFASYFSKIKHNDAKLALCNMVVFGIRQKVDISDYNDETMHQFIENANEINSEENINS
jgi:hypothetical protein